MASVDLVAESPDRVAGDLLRMPAATARGARRGPVPHLEPSERTAAGRAARAEVPRSVHGVWEPAPDRPDPVELLEEQSATRVPELVPVRYGRMLVSPFTFFRGAAYPMAADLARQPRTGLHVQLCGDAHLSNFGGFASPDRRLIFGVNDFDETLPGPFEWDVKRLVASFAVAGRDRGFDSKQRRSINTAVARAYREAMRELRRHGQPRRLVRPPRRRGVRRARRQTSDRQAGEALREERREGARQGQPEGVRQAHARSSTASRGSSSDPPLIVPIEDARAAEPSATASRTTLRGVIRSYRRTLTADRRRLLERYRYVHAARKVVGVGSVGTRAWIVLLLGRDDERPAVPAVQGGRGVGARAVPRQEHAQQPRPARRRGPTHDAGHQRHPPRLDQDRVLRRRRARLLRPPALGREGLRARRGHEPQRR